MYSEITATIPEADCYICASPHVVKICHHCQRGMCKLHGPFTKPKNKRFWRYENNEFTQLGLKEIEKREEGIHCEFCNHYNLIFKRIYYTLALVGFVLAAFSFLSSNESWMFSLQAAGIYFILLSSIGIIGERLISMHRIRNNILPAPVFGRFPQVKVSEKVEGTINLDQQGNYSSKVRRAIGKISTSLRFTDTDQQVLARYLQKYGFSQRETITFNAGYVTIHGTQKLTRFNWATRTDNPIVLTGRTIGQQLPRHDRSWEQEKAYDFSSPDLNMTNLPVQIIPTLINEEKEWALGILVQFYPNLLLPAHIHPIIEELTVRAPRALGNIEHCNPAAPPPFHGTADWSTLIWRGLVFDSDPISGNSKSFYVRYSNNTQETPDQEICGRLRVRFNGAVSGIEEVKFFSPLGHIRQDESVQYSQKTEFDIHFRFRLSGLCMRRIYSNTQLIEQPTAVPGNATITRLVNAINNEQIYVQRVIENPPYMNQAHAQILNRFWVIAGRQYTLGIPVDFRIVATGQEKYEDSDRADTGSSRFEINTQGNILNSDMSEQINNLQKTITDKIQCIPDLELVSIFHEKLFRENWIQVSGLIKNVGRVGAKDIRILVKGKTIEAGPQSTIKSLMPNDERPFELTIATNRSGNTPITFIAICKDEYGQLPPMIWTRHIVIQ